MQAPLRCWHKQPFRILSLILPIVGTAVGNAVATNIITGTDAGATAHVKAFNGNTGTETASFLPYGPSFSGGVRVATGDVNGDGIADIITGAGPGAGPHVKAFSGVDQSELKSFFAYTPSYTGGIFVAAGDVTGDHVDDIFTGTDTGTAGHVKVFNGSGGVEIASFLPYGAAFAGGVRVAAGDVNGDGIDDIITGAGPGGGPHVKAFSGVDQSELKSFFAYPPGFAGGVYVAAGDVNGDHFDDIITGAGTDGGTHVKVFSGANNSELHSFFAFAGFAAEVRVGAGDVNDDGIDDIIAGLGPGPRAPTPVKAFSGVNLDVLRNFLPYGAEFSSGVYVAGIPAAPVPESSTLLLAAWAWLVFAPRSIRRCADANE